MEEILKYENRNQLYAFLLENFGFSKINENYDHEHFGNFFIILSNSEILIKYLKDRSFLTIEIANINDPDDGYDLSFVKDYIYKTYMTNEEIKRMDNKSRIDLLNNFIKNDFNKIVDLFSSHNYPQTKRLMFEYLKSRFIEKHH